MQTPSNKSIGVILLILYLLVIGIVGLTNLTFVGLPIILAVLAIGAGIFLAIGR